MPQASAAIMQRLVQAKAALGDRLVILCHHYQPDEVARFADHMGDSLALSRLAATRREAKYIVFCGVYFMAETADILSTPEQVVLMPDPKAGCPMADMAPISLVETCWERLTTTLGEDIIPITYVNSSAPVKGFCGRHNGVTCTSSNAAGVMQWAFEHAGRVLFLPDRHLGANTARKLGLDTDQIAVWDRRGGILEGGEWPAAKNLRLILWNGYCPVHVRFNPQQIAAVRAAYRGIKVLVHPECTEQTVRQADGDGSTEYLIRRVEEAQPGEAFAIGTELRLVQRLARTNPDRTVLPLDERHSICEDMSKGPPASLLVLLEGLLEGELRGRVQVAGEDAHWARQALEKMLAISG